MFINITSEEKDRIGLTGGLTYTNLEFGITLEYCDMEHSRDLYNLLWRYKVQDEKRFMTAVIKYGIKYKNVIKNKSNFMEQNNYRKRIYFDNEYGLSIVSHSFSYGGDEGLFEVALLNSNGDLIYDESLGFEDVLKYLDFQEVADLINKVKKFDKLNHI